MAHDDPHALDRTYQAPAGLSVDVSDPAQNPGGLPPHRERITDQDPKAMKAAVRTVYTLFYLSLAGSIWRSPPTCSSRSRAARSSMCGTTTCSSASASPSPCSPSVSVRSTGRRPSWPTTSTSSTATPTRGRDSTREAAIKAFADANEESGFGRRVMIRNSLIAAVVAPWSPGLALFRGLAPAGHPPRGPPSRASRSSCSSTPCGRRACAWRTTPTAPRSARRTSRSARPST